MKPIFFSVSDSDIKFAETLWGRFASDLIYLYSQNGLRGADMWAEIEKEELPNARALVIFWSAHFARSKGTQREIALASRLYETGQVRGVVILRLDDYPLTAPPLETDPQVLATHNYLKVFTSVVRTSEAGLTPEAAFRQAESLVTRFAFQSAPIFSRPELEEEMLRQARIDHRTFRPMIWVSGLNGYGRKTAVREAFRRIDPNAGAVEIDISECSIPLQAVLRLESEAFLANQQRLEEVNADPHSNTVDAVAEVISRIHRGGRYTVLRQQRIVEDGNPLPEWLFGVAQKLPLTNQPAAFVISQAPIPTPWLQKCGDHMGAVRVAALAPVDAERFAWSMVRYFDPVSDRWTPEWVSRIAREAGGTPEIIVSSIRLGARLSELTGMDNMLGVEIAKFSETLSGYVNWAMKIARQDANCMRLLKVLQDINPASLDLLNDLLGEEFRVGRSLAQLHTLGLVEQTESALYRISSLLSRRLVTYLADPELTNWSSEVFRRFATSPLLIPDGEHSFLRIEFALEASIRFTDRALPPELATFVSASHWFQIGIKLYSLRKHHQAHQILAMAFERRESFLPAARIELARYFGLASVRAHQKNDVKRAKEALIELAGGLDLVEYLDAFEYELDRRYFEAMAHYEKALLVAKGQGSAVREREARILRPLINCILRTPRPNFARAEELAARAVEISRSVFSLHNHARVLLNRSYRDVYLDGPGKDAAWGRYLDALEAVERWPYSGSVFAELRAEEDQFTGDWDSAVAWMDEAIKIDPRFENRLRRWKIMVRSKRVSLAESVLQELDDYFLDSTNKADLAIFKVPVVELFAMAQKIAGHSGAQKQRLQQYGQGLGAAIMSRIARDTENQTMTDGSFLPEV